MRHFEEAQKAGAESAHLFNFMGMCEGQLGNVAASLQHHKSSMVLNANFRECAINLAQMYREMGEYDESEAAFGHAIELYSRDADNNSADLSVDSAVNISPDSNNRGGKRSGSLAVAHKYRGMLRYSRGLRKGPSRTSHEHCS